MPRPPHKHDPDRTLAATPGYQGPTLGPGPAVEPGASQTARPAPAAIALGSLIGKYRVYAVLGHGGMGNVYAAKDPLIKRDVAIKILPQELVGDSATLARFLAEARSAGQLNHPNVVTIYEVVQIEDGSYAIVMELVGGGSVQSYLAKKGPPGWRGATRIIGEACKALSAAHDAGLIHRDIKPANLLLTTDGHVKVADFGLAKADAPGSQLNTQPGMILGTPAFMSPEQCRGETLDRRADIYSLGCTFYAMLTNKPPFEAASSMQVMFAHCSAPIPDPRSLDAAIPQECVQILTRALAKKPDDRYAAAREFLADVRAALGGQTISGAGPMPPSADMLMAASTDDGHAEVGRSMSDSSAKHAAMRAHKGWMIAAVLGAAVLLVMVGLALARVIWGVGRPSPAAAQNPGNILNGQPAIVAPPGEMLSPHPPMDKGDGPPGLHRPMHHRPGGPGGPGDEGDPRDGGPHDGGPRDGGPHGGGPHDGPPPAKPDFDQHPRMRPPPRGEGPASAPAAFVPPAMQVASLPPVTQPSIPSTQPTP